MATMMDMVSGDILDEFSEQIDSFRRTYLLRVLALLAAIAWAVGMVVLFRSRTTKVVAALLGFEALCWVSYRLCVTGRLRLAQHVLVATLDIWALGLVWFVPDPMLLFVPVLAAQVGVAVVERGQAITYAVLLIAAQLISGIYLFPDLLLTRQLLLPPLMTVVVTALSLIWGVSLYTALGWAVHSTRTAVERLEETQEHRARLHRSMEKLDAANRRLVGVNEMLRSARAEAESAQQARNQFALTVSHELRTPLNFIIGYSEMMINSPDVYGDVSKWPPGLYDDIRDIYNSSSHLLRLVNDILDLGQAEAQQLILAKEWISPAMIVQETVEIMRAAAGARHLYLQLQMDQDLPLLFVDRTRIRQVLINLIGNSLRFTEEGGITLEVRKRATDVLFTVADTGIGIPADDLPRVFEDFGQADTTIWRRRGGSGLGVPISQRFVRMHGGEMWLESEVDQGTSFYFSLPLPGVVYDGVRAAGDDGSWLTTPSRYAPQKTILLVSQDPGSGQSIQRLVDEFQIIPLAGLEQARTYAENHLPHALIVDERVASVEEVDRLASGLPYDLPVLIFRLPGASSSSPELPAGVVAHLIKPVLREHLSELVTNMVSPVHHILLVDDDIRMERFVGLALAASRGERSEDAQAITVKAVGTGEGALAMLAEDAERAGGESPGRKIDLVLLDLDLPDMSGWDLLERIRHLGYDSPPPVALVTALDLRKELTLPGSNLIGVRRRRPLRLDEMEAVLPILLQTLRPLYSAGTEPRWQTEGPLA